MKLELPKYTTSQSVGQFPKFITTVVFSGKPFSGDACRSKREAEELGARAVIQWILGQSDATNAMVEMIKSKAKLFDVFHRFSSSVVPQDNNVPLEVSGENIAKEKNILTASTNGNLPVSAAELSSLPAAGNPTEEHVCGDSGTLVENNTVPTNQNNNRAEGPTTGPVNSVSSNSCPDLVIKIKEEGPSENPPMLPANLQTPHPSSSGKRRCKNRKGSASKKMRTNEHLIMTVVEYRCFIGGLSRSTKDDDLRDAFEKFGRLSEAKVVIDRFYGSCGCGFVTFVDKKAMEEAIDAMNGIDLDGRNITVEKAQPQGSGRDRDGDRGYERGHDRDHGRDSCGGRGSGVDCFKCGKPGHFAWECPSGYGGRGDRYGGRDDRCRCGGDNGRHRPDRYGDRYGGGRSRDGGSRGGSGSDIGDRYGGRDDRCGGGCGNGRHGPDRDGDRWDGGSQGGSGSDIGDRYGGRDDRYGGGCGNGRHGPDRDGDRYGGGRSRDGESRGGLGSDRYNPDRCGPYECPSGGGGYRS